MTKEEAIWYLQPIADSASLPRYAEALNLAIAAMKEREQNKWISAKDRLPEPDTDVLARCFYHEEWQMRVCHVSKRNEGQWYTSIAGQLVTVTRWMPLPKPPKEDVE